jgi:hypothetical protein
VWWWVKVLEESEGVRERLVGQGVREKERERYTHTKSERYT